MPLLEGRANIGKNITELMAAGRKRDQAVAIALDHERRTRMGRKEKEDEKESSAAAKREDRVGEEKGDDEKKRRRPKQKYQDRHDYREHMLNKSWIPD